MKSITTINPTTREEIKTYNLLTPQQVQESLELVYNQWLEYRHTTFDQRARWMMRAAQILLDRKEQYAEIMVQEMGKVRSAGIGEIEKCAWVCRYYAEHAERFLDNEYIEADVTKSYVAFRPLGPVLAVMPWNYPFWQVFRFAAPALMAGNAGLLKHASNVPECALSIQSVFEDAGFPTNVFKTLLISSSEVEKVLSDPRVKAATLTGSGPAGSAVAATAGKQLKKTVLELGGSDPYLILEDADLEHAAGQCTASRLLNAGQSCIGAKRFIIVESVYAEFLELFKHKMKAAQMGNPMEAVDLGPMARHDLRDEVHEQVVKSVEQGATIELGGKIPAGPGAFYPPTILTGVAPGMPAYHEEIFGPVASVIQVKDEAEAIRIANDTDFGLGAAVFTQDLDRGERIARDELQAGCCFVNHFVKSDPRLPFGGIGISGYGRELSHYGIREFTNIKTVSVK